MAVVLQFPKVQNDTSFYEVDVFEEARKAMESRLGVSLSDYFHQTGDPEKTSDIIDRNMKRETLKARTELIYQD